MRAVRSKLNRKNLIRASYAVIPSLVISVVIYSCNRSDITYNPPVDDAAVEQIAKSYAPPSLADHMANMGYSTIDTFLVTAYLAIDEYENRFHGITYSGVPAKANHTVAVDPRVVPLGGWLYIENLGWYRAEDTGNMIKGNRLDICVETRTEAMKWGKRKMQVWFLSPEQFAQANEPENAAVESESVGSSS
ncbi:MAG: hypothetical protein GY839_09605 [candidate division Zixibacteria bacterium]|nr:hypothetical protein [candidate division Zixibacteria bacterium]